MKKQRLGIRHTTKSVWMRFVPMGNLTIVFSVKIFGLRRRYPMPFPPLENVSLRMNMNLWQRHSHNKYSKIPTIRIGACGSLLHKHILICIPVLKIIRTFPQPMKSHTTMLTSWLQNSANKTTHFLRILQSNLQKAQTKKQRSKSNLTTTFFPKPERLSCALCMSR